jgi:hypothetical protein
MNCFLSIPHWASTRMLLLLDSAIGIDTKGIKRADKP